MQSSIPSNQTDYIENEFNSFVINEIEFDIPNRGASFHFDICAKVPMERMLYDGDQIHSLDAAGTEDGFLQIFRASANNIHDIQLSLSGCIEADHVLQNYDGYVDTADLQSDWVSSDLVNTVVSLDTSMPYEGTQCMRVNVSRRKSPGDTITYTYPVPQDWFSREALHFMFNSSVAGTYNQWVLIIGDGSNEASIRFNAQNANTWEDRSLPFAAFTDIGLIDRAKIQYIQLQLESVTFSATCYFDYWALVGGADSNSTVIRLYDFGTNALPTSLGTQMPHDYEVLEVPIELSTDKRVHQIHLHLGSHELEQTLTKGNYYGIYVSKPDQGTLYLHGSSQQTYQSGKCYSDTAGSLMVVDGTLGFMVMSSIEARLSQITVEPDANAGSSKTFLFVVDHLTGETIFFSEMTLEEQGQILVLKDILPEYLWTSQTKRLSIYYQDGMDSNATKLTCRPKFYYNSLPVYG